MGLKESISAILKAEEHEAGKDFDSSSKNVQTLLNIFNREKEKEKIIGYVFNYYNPEFSYLGFEFLIRIKEFKRAYEYFGKNLSKIRENPPYFSSYYRLFNRCLKRLSFVLEEEKFTIKEIELLRDYVLEMNNFVPKKHEKLASDYFSDSDVSLNNELRKEVVKKIDLKKAELTKNNYDKDLMKEDLDFVVDKIKEMELGNGIAIAFTKLEERYYEARDLNDFAMYGGYIRETIMSLVKAMALRISKDKKEVVKERDEHYRNYLKKVGMINEGMWRMLSALYDFLSCGINHNIEIDGEYYKRGLNITSQIAYLLLKDYEIFLEKERTQNRSETN